MSSRIYILLVFIAISKFITAGNSVGPCDSTITNTIVIQEDSCSIVQKPTVSIENDSLHHKKSQVKKKKREKVLAAILAFPFPFGFVGAHRVMLGTKPWVPLVYVATFGGCFGVLPLIDFCVIICNKDLKKFENDPNVFMWTK